MTQKPTRLEDLARIAGVSTATISRALNDSPNVNPETKRRVWQLAKEHNYSFRPHMPAILTRAASTIAIVIPMQPGREYKNSDPFYLELIGGVCSAAREISCDVVISHLAPKNFDDLSGLVDSSRTNGIIFLGQSFLHDRFNFLTATNRRFIVWGAQMDGQQYCSVGSDNRQGGERATAHLLRLGRRRIAFLGDMDAPELRQRYEGYIRAHHTAGLEADPALTSSASFELESAEAAVDAMASAGHDFDAVFAGSDLIAIGAIRAIQRSGRQVPDDVAVVGYDNIKLAQYSSPALTTIAQDMTKAGRMMVSKLLSSPDMQASFSERLPTELIIRSSCGA